MRIAYVGHPNSPNSWYRAIGPVEALMHARGYEGRCVMPEAATFRTDLVRGCDALLIHRECGPAVVKAAQYANEAGIAVVWDNDDDFRAVPRRDPAYRLVSGARSGQIQAAIRKVVRLADVVTTPSATLAEQFRDAGAADVRVIENHVPDDAAGVSPSRASSRSNGAGADLLIGWIAGGEHRVDVERLPLAEVALRLLEAHPSLRLTTIGAWLGVRHARYLHQDRVLYMNLARTAATFDVGIAPIADIPFNRTRSNVKLKEYAVVGVPWLASAIGPYAGMGEGQGGRLVQDGDWYVALERLATNARERRKLAKRSLKWGRGQMISANLGQWEAVLDDAVARARARVGRGAISPSRVAGAARGSA